MTSISLYVLLPYLVMLSHYPHVLTFHISFLYTCPVTLFIQTTAINMSHWREIFCAVFKTHWNICLLFLSENIPKPAVFRMFVTHAVKEK